MKTIISIAATAAIIASASAAISVNLYSDGECQSDPVTETFYPRNAVGANTCYLQQGGAPPVYSFMVIDTTYAEYNEAWYAWSPHNCPDISSGVTNETTADSVTGDNAVPGGCSYGSGQVGVCQRQLTLPMQGFSSYMIDPAVAGCVTANASTTLPNVYKITAEDGNWPGISSS